MMESNINRGLKLLESMLRDGQPLSSIMEVVRPLLVCHPAHAPCCFVFLCIALIPGPHTPTLQASDSGAPPYYVVDQAQAYL
jgi:hypothetical protein